MKMTVDSVIQAENFDQEEVWKRLSIKEKKIFEAVLNEYNPLELSYV